MCVLCKKKKDDDFVVFDICFSIINKASNIYYNQLNNDGMCFDFIILFRVKSNDIDNIIIFGVCVCVFNDWFKNHIHKNHGFYI